MSEKIEKQENEVEVEKSEIIEEEIINEKEEIKVSSTKNIKQKIKEEIDSYQKDEEATLDKYAKFSLANLHYITIGIASSLVLLHSGLAFKFVSQLIGLFFLIFAVSTLIIAKYYVKNKDNESIKLYIYDCWQKAILTLIVVNFALYAVSDNPHDEMMVILSFAAIATIAVQRGVKRSLSLLL